MAQTKHLTTAIGALIKAASGKPSTNPIGATYAPLSDHVSDVTGAIQHTGEAMAGRVA